MTIETIITTLQTYDPEQATITVGSAAIAVHFAKVGLDFTAEDVDVLCSDSFFIKTGTAMLTAEPDTIKKFQIRYPYGEPHTRALSPVLDIYPGEKAAANTLSFSASVALGGKWHPMTYENCISAPDKIVRHAGFMFLSMAEVLLWTAKAGREKDLAKIEKLLPLSLEHELISAEQYRQIKIEQDHSAKLRTLHPRRYFARVEP